MIRIEEFDVINKKRLGLLRCLAEREMDLGEVCRQVYDTRSAVFYNLKLLTKYGLVAKKSALKKNVWKKARKTHREVVRYQLTEKGKLALQYFTRELSE